MKKIMIYAYTAINLGDDLFIKILCERYPHVQFIVQADGYKKKFKNIKNLKCYSTEFLFIKIINKLFHILGFRNIKQPNIKEKLLLKQVDGSIYIGGSIFMETEGWEERLRILEERIDSQKNFYIIGCNFGPYSTDEFYKKHKKIFKKCKDVCFREEYSYNLFKGISNIRRADDVVFGLNMRNIGTKNNISISIIDLENRKNLKEYSYQYINKIAQLCRYIIDRGDDVTLISFCKLEGDTKAISKVLNLLEEDYRKKIIVRNYIGNIEEILKILGSSKLIVGTRFHSMILGFTLGVPVFPIIYSNKMKNVLEDIEFEGEFTSIQNISSVSVEQIYNSINTNRINVLEQKSNAEKQFEVLDRYVRC